MGLTEQLPLLSQSGELGSIGYADEWAADNSATILDTVNLAGLREQALPDVWRTQAILWLAARQITTGPHAGFWPAAPIGPRADLLFTGERLHTRLAASYILAAETARALCLLGGANEILTQTDRRLAQLCIARGCIIGECAHSTLGLMRYLAVGGLNAGPATLDRHLAALRERRSGDGRWQGFPFYYALLAVSEIERPAAVDELRYARPACERAWQRLDPSDRFAGRRALILERAMSAH